VSTRRPGLASRVALLTTGVAALAVLLSGVVTLGLVRRAADDQARRLLGRQAETIAEIVETQPRRQVPALQVLRRQGIRAAIVGRDRRRSDAPDTAGEQLREALRNRVEAAAGGEVSFTTDLLGEAHHVEGRRLSDGRWLYVAQPVALSREGAFQPVGRRLVLAGSVGLVVAALIGLALAERVARPLKNAAAAAHRFASGVRGERLEPTGPAEVAEVAESFNTLAGALEHSEGRQREFLLSVSHELRTPLTAIKGFAEALADGVTEPTDVAATGTVILNESQRLERLVSDLLDLARLGAQDFRIDTAPVDLTALLQQAGDVWSSRCARDGVELRVEVPDEPVVVLTDPVRVRQIVDGLAENALRVTPTGEPIVFAVRREAGGVVLQVRDGGPGLTPDDCVVAFDRSALYDRYRGVRRVGTGVGLALVAGLARRLGGSAHAGQAAEGGACFTIRLPAARDAVKEAGHTR
jgi:two-component system OmpR family sensor kinase